MAQAGAASSPNPETPGQGEGFGGVGWNFRVLSMLRPEPRFQGRKS